VIACCLEREHKGRQVTTMRARDAHRFVIYSSFHRVIASKEFDDQSQNLEWLVQMSTDHDIADGSA